eukprot:1188016-Prorocentrum_minimum.AAC.4
MESQVRQDLEKAMMNKAKEEVEVAVEKKLQQIQEKKVKEEKEKLKIQKEMQKASGEMQEAKMAQIAEKEKIEEIRAKLQAMESKVVHGDENLIEKLEECDKEAELLEQEKAVAAEKEEERRRKMAELDEMQLMQEEKFSSVQEEVEQKTKKIKKLWNKYQSTKSEIIDLQEEFQRERDDLLEDVRRLTREIKMKNLIIDTHIPPEELDKIHRRAVFDESGESWEIDRLQYAGNHVRARQAAEILRARREKGDFTVPAGFDFSEADLEYVGYDVNGVPMDSRMQAAIKQAFEQDGGMVFNQNEKLTNVYFSYAEGGEAGGMEGYEDAPPARPKSARPKSGRPRTASKKAHRDSVSAGIGKLTDHVANLKDDNSAKNFPKARGLVKK